MTDVEDKVKAERIQLNIGRSYAHSCTINGTQIDTLYHFHLPTACEVYQTAGAAYGLSHTTPTSLQHLEQTYSFCQFLSVIYLEALASWRSLAYL